jgi:surface antigen
LLEILLAGIIQWETINKNIEEDNGIQFSSYILHSDSSNDRVTFVPGDSQYDIEQKRQVEDEQRKVLATKSYTTYQNRQTSYEGNPYPYGWCTWYAAQKKNISTSFGDARYWPVNSKEPQAGAVVVTYESPRGHVAYVEAVEGDKIVVSEMNYIGWGKTNTRVIDKNSRFIKGYLI